MNAWERYKFLKMRESFAQAEQEGKILQWFFKRFLLWLLGLVLKLLFVLPLMLVWHYSFGEGGRHCETFIRLLRFVLGVFFYFGIWAGIIKNILDKLF